MAGRRGDFTCGLPSIDLLGRHVQKRSEDLALAGQRHGHSRLVCLDRWPHLGESEIQKFNTCLGHQNARGRKLSLTSAPEVLRITVPSTSSPPPRTRRPSELCRSVGHASSETTNRYAEITLRTKQAALEKCTVPGAADERIPRKPLWQTDASLLSWLQSL